MLNRLTDALDFQGRALALRGDRQRLIASNIANADTPGYLAREMDFAAALREAGGGASAAGSPSRRLQAAAGAAATLATTQPGHIAADTRAVGGAGGPAGFGRDDAGLLYATASQTSLDRNTVDMDRERASFADNTVKAEAALRFINGQVRTVLDAIKGQ